MKARTILLNACQAILLIAVCISAWTSQWLYGTYLLLLLIYFELDAIHDTIKEAKPTEQEPVGFAGIEIWIGNKRIKKLMTQAELHSAIDPWAIVKFNSDGCIDALKEKNND